jgi:hypothetical protein
MWTLWIHKAIGDGFLVNFPNSTTAYNYGRAFLSRDPNIRVSWLNSIDTIISQNTPPAPSSIGFTPTVEVFMYSSSNPAPSATHGLMTVAPEVATLITGYI